MSKVAIVFNLHQPDYADTRPWTILHTLSGYRDMAQFLMESKGARVSINISGTLLAQWRRYANMDNLWLSLTASLEGQNPQDWLGATLEGNTSSDMLADTMEDIIPIYKSLHETGRVELMTTPYSHPLLPLLREENAKRQISVGQANFKSAFGFTPKSMWSPECAVSQDSMRILGEMGIENTVTGASVTGSQGQWQVSGVNLFARDDHISDAIGFEYQHWNPEDAARDIKRRVLENPGLTVIALDGENFLPYYKNHGKDFMLALYKELDGLMVTLSEAHDNNAHEYRNLNTGSWVHGSLDHWLVGPYKEYTAKVKEHVELAAQMAPSLSFTATHYLMNIESSDWSWFDDGPLASVFERYVNRFYESVNLNRPYLKAPSTEGIQGNGSMHANTI